MSEFNKLLTSNNMNINPIGKIIKTSDNSESIFLR
jgi:hypothetical protein